MMKVCHICGRKGLPMGSISKAPAIQKITPCKINPYAFLFYKTHSDSCLMKKNGLKVDPVGFIFLLNIILVLASLCF